jgi:hypothetical protein
VTVLLLLLLIQVQQRSPQQLLLLAAEVGGEGHSEAYVQHTTPPGAVPKHRHALWCTA